MDSLKAIKDDPNIIELRKNNTEFNERFEQDYKSNTKPIEDYLVENKKLILLNKEISQRVSPISQELCKLNPDKYTNQKVILGLDDMVTYNKSTPILDAVKKLKSNANSSGNLGD